MKIDVYADKNNEKDSRRPKCTVSRFIEKKLRLKINREKSAIGRPWDRKYLGFCMTNSRSKPKIRIHWKTIKRFKERVREITARRRGRSIPQVIGELKRFMNGWWNYYGITESFNRLRPLPHWIRRRLRAVIWKHWPPARRACASERRTAKPVCGSS
jgi:hypothetical protein